MYGELGINIIERTEELEQALDLAEEITRLKSQMALTMSHELRTLLTSILRPLRLVTQGITGKIPQKAKDFLEMAWRNSEQLAAIVNDILVIERLESGKQPLHLIPLNVTQLWKLTIKMNSGLAEENDVEMVEYLTVFGDEGRLHQSIAYLFSTPLNFQKR